MSENFVKFGRRQVTTEEGLSPGHRFCIGCGEALAVRLACKALGKNTIIANATGCIEICTSAIPHTSWRVPWIHTLFENTAAVASGMESGLKAMMRKNKVAQREIHYVAMAGDGGTSDIGIQALSGALERGHDFLYICFDNEAYMNCLSTSSMIMTEDGLKRITDVKEGEEVYAFDQIMHQPVLKKCTGVFDNGVREVFELETLHHSIKATLNHPFLVLKRNGRGKNNGFIWKTLEEIEIGDEVVVLKNLDGGSSFEFDFNKVEKGDYKVTHLNEVNLPEYSSPDLMKYLGMFVGDGWVRTDRGEVGFALPEGSKAREVFFELNSNVFGGKVKSDDMYVYTNSVNIARFIDSLGFGHGAKNKAIPPWVFTLPHLEIESFIEGLMLSDGYKIGNSSRYVSTSSELLKGMRLLLQTMDFRVGKIHWQKKEKGTKCVDRELLNDSEYGYICFSKRNDWNIKKYPSQYRYQNFLIENNYFETEKVRSVTFVGNEPTLDLRVEDEHNFIADGIVVHNTGIQRSSATPYGASTTTAPAGKKATTGQSTWKKDMPAIIVAHNIPYVATACPSYPFDLIEKVKKGAEVKGPAYVHIFSPCPTGWRVPTDQTIQIGRLAVETGVFPLYEVENGEYKMTVSPPKLKPVAEYLKAQGRFRHLPDEEIRKIQERVDKEYLKIKEKAKA